MGVNKSIPIRTDFDRDRFLSHAPNLEALPVTSLEQIRRNLARGSSKSERAILWMIEQILKGKKCSQN